MSTHVRSSIYLKKDYQCLIKIRFCSKFPYLPLFAIMEFLSVYTALNFTIYRLETKRNRLFYNHTDRRQSKTLSTIDERRSKIDRNGVFDCHLSPKERQIAIENIVSNDFYLRPSIVLVLSIAAYPECG